MTTDDTTVQARVDTATEAAVKAFNQSRSGRISHFHIVRAMEAALAAAGVSALLAEVEDRAATARLAAAGMERRGRERDAARAEVADLRAAVERVKVLADRWACNCGGPSPEGHHEMHCDSYYGSEVRAALATPDREEGA